jgi:hypothetical protein
MVKILLELEYTHYYLRYDQKGHCSHNCAPHPICICKFVICIERLFEELKIKIKKGKLNSKIISLEFKK